MGDSVASRSDFQFVMFISMSHKWKNELNCKKIQFYSSHNQFVIIISALYLRLFETFYKICGKKWENLGNNALILPHKIAIFLSYPIDTYHCKLDGKGRLMLPADFRDKLKEVVQQGFVLRPGLFDKYLELYTMQDWMKVQSKLRKLNQFVKSNVDFVRKYNAGAKEVKIDSLGRLQIPKNLIEDGGLTKEVVLNSVTKNIEIWDKDAFTKVQACTDQEAFLKFAADVLGNISDEND